MTTTIPGDLPLSESTLWFPYTEEHLALHQYMHESTAADTSSRGFPPEEPGEGSANQGANLRDLPPAQVRIRAYP